MNTGEGEFLTVIGNIPVIIRQQQRDINLMYRYVRKDFFLWGFSLRSAVILLISLLRIKSFDIIINRHGDFNVQETYRLLKNKGMFITEQVGGDNDRDLVEMVLPGTQPPFPHMNLKEQKKIFEEAGFRTICAKEAYRPILFYDVGAFVWFARIIQWEFPGFSVECCFEKLVEMQKILEKNGEIQGTIHRYLIVAEKQLSDSRSQQERKL